MDFQNITKVNNVIKRKIGKKKKKGIGKLDFT